MAESNYVLKDIADNRGRADIGSAIFIKRDDDTKYHLWLPVTNMPATGSAPETIDTTVTSTRVSTSAPGRVNPGQKEFTFFAHRDNFEIIKKDYMKQRKFLQVNPDGTGWRFDGKVTTYQDETSVNNAETAKGNITVSHADELPLINVMDIIQETVTYTSPIDDVIKVEGKGTHKVQIETDPADATVKAESDTASVATATIESGVLTITGVAKGSAIITITASKAECSDGVTHILVIVD